MSVEAVGRFAKLNDAMRQTLMQRIERIEANAGKGADRRSSPRLPYHRNDVAFTVHHPGGGSTQAAVMTRDLSAGGVMLLYDGFLHAGTECRIVLPRRAGTQPCRGVVRWCRHVLGAFHAIGVEFEERIVPEVFLGLDGAERTVVDPKLDPAQIAGRVLFVDPEVVDRDLFQFVMSSTAATTAVAGSAAEAVEALGKEKFDLVVTELALGDVPGEEAIGKFRAAGFGGAILVLTGETDPGRLRAAAEAGAKRVIRKPYEAALLFTNLAEWLGGGGAVEEPIHTTLPDNPKVTAVVEQYINRVRELADAIRQGVCTNDFKGVRHRCLTLKGTGSGYGFEVLSAVANDAVKALDASMSVSESVAELEQLDSVARRLKATPKK